MSLFAGIYSLRDGVVPDPDAVDAICRLLSRRGDELESYSDRRFFIAKLDVGAFGSRAFLADGAVTAVTGEPFLDPDSALPSREEDVRRLAVALSSDEFAVLRRCQGCFSVCHYDPVAPSLTLATDRLGARPVYFSVGETAVYFSSNLRVLEGITQVPKRADLRGITEEIAIGHPLGDRSAYVDIKVLRGGTAVRWRDGTRSDVAYFRFADIQQSSLSREEMLDVMYETFMAAVACQGAGSEQANAFLSGGLDSRVIVAALCALGKTVYTLTYEVPGTKDALFSRRFAEHMGTHHNPRPFDPSKGHRQHTISSAGQIRYPPSRPAEFPLLIFSGDGGSCGLGFTGMGDRLVAMLRAGDYAKAADWLSPWLPERLYRREVWREAKDVVAESILAELRRAETRDPAWDLYALSMARQGRWLHVLFEDLDLLRMELLLPFHDGRLLELIVSGQLEWFMGHRFYNDWLSKFSGGVDSIPWQSYKGHAPCPHPEASEGFRQGTSRAERTASAAPDFRRCRALLFKRGYPSGLLRRLPMAPVLALHGLGLGNYQTVFKTCIGYQKRLAQSEGTPVWTEA